MLQFLCYVLIGYLLMDPAGSNRSTASFVGQCPTMRPVPHNSTDKIAFEGSWYQYAVYPSYLQDKCIKREFTGSPYWQQFAQTDIDNFIVQYFCYDYRQRGILGRQHTKSVNIYVREAHSLQATIDAITDALKRNFKFPVHLLNYTEYSFCTEVESKPALVRV